MADIAAERGFAKGRVAVGMGARACTGRYLNRLEDATRLLSSLHFVKTADELAQLRNAEKMAELGLAAAQSSLRGGMTEIDADGMA